MSDFLNKLEAKRKKNTATESMTIRVTAEEDAAIKELANYYDCTRQELMHDLITEYLMPAWSRLMEETPATEQLEVEVEKGKKAYYVLNTNKVHDVADHDFMIREGVAAAFEDGYKEKIDKFKSGDTVFLYESGKGVVAFGTASGKTLKKDHNGRPDKTYYQTLAGFTKLDAPVSPKDICRILGRNIKFVQTLTYLSDGEALLEKLGSK
jgi:hypothetical protein